MFGRSALVWLRPRSQEPPALAVGSFRLGQSHSAQDVRVEIFVRAVHGYQEVSSRPAQGVRVETQAGMRVWD